MKCIGVYSPLMVSHKFTDTNSNYFASLWWQLESTPHARVCKHRSRITVAASSGGWNKDELAPKPAGPRWNPGVSVCAHTLVPAQSWWRCV